MDNNFAVGDKVKILGKYSGISSKNTYTVIALSPEGNKVTICRPEFQTGKETFNLQWHGKHCNDYTGYLIKSI